VITLTKTKVIAYLAAIFAAGVLAGGAGGYALSRPRPGPKPGPPDPKGMVQHTLQRLESRLQLNPDQLGKIRGIVEQSFTEAHQCNSSHFKEVGEIFRRMNSRISEHLTPDQKDEFERMEKERWERMRSWGRSKGGSSPGDGKKPASKPPAEPRPDGSPVTPP
jgi:hypothetical protein